ncbi:hypothetical protein EMIHUDRAFT_247406 [Emiliania huxleyi CCMP1516]|uniref:Uncharacterized protein n=2 Tax=Emiliania huxleyi TaxID=2903 RepID=A0A0D3IMP3_EMIH1|nr:hypothetical protein EMIHUDRAFT_247406 [Emiliania huxleyi CCMP1516]EOD12528.1 hypothetical protein EMIHUDRAFT_247406 [Emiliania huxleyi CCMP1516]|eukprot:XP_005764957.1 hypothetical protein EMIHUDRAFT_247406 [Emiliania huxleyi CCMP1516]
MPERVGGVRRKVENPTYGATARKGTVSYINLVAGAPTNCESGYFWNAGGSAACEYALCPDGTRYNNVAENPTYGATARKGTVSYINLVAGAPTNCESGYFWGAGGSAACEYALCPDGTRYNNVAENPTYGATARKGTVSYINLVAGAPTNCESGYFWNAGGSAACEYALCPDGTRYNNVAENPTYGATARKGTVSYINLVAGAPTSCESGYFWGAGGSAACEYALCPDGTRYNNADFRGRNGAYYNFFSAPRLTVNVKTEDASFRLHGGKLIVHGSFLTEAHIVASSSNISAPARASFFAHSLNDENWGWNVINGTCKHRHFQFGRSGFKQCGDLRIEMAFSHATFNLGNWTITVRGNHVYSWISGPKHRVDVSFSARGDAATRSLPHGIIGQSFASAAPRYGLLDDYPKTGEFTTSAMGEGAIEGEATMYEMPSSHATDYAFSRFHKAEAVIDPDPLLALGASAATVQDV